MKIVVAVLGKDRPGIIAGVSAALYSANANILDITQTVLRNSVFTMVMLVDAEHLTVSFAELKETLDACGRELGMEINVQREELFASMHRL